MLISVDGGCDSHDLCDLCGYGGALMSGALMSALMSDVDDNHHLQMEIYSVYVTIFFTPLTPPPLKE
jgi:hypothetical protein